MGRRDSFVVPVRSLFYPATFHPHYKKEKKPESVFAPWLTFYHPIYVSMYLFAEYIAYTPAITSPTIQLNAANIIDNMTRAFMTYLLLDIDHS